MPENISPNGQDTRLVVRVGQKSLSFSTLYVDEERVDFAPYTLKNGISIAANLREALRQQPHIKAAAHQKVLVMIDSEVLMVPTEEYNEAEKEVLYFHSFPSKKGCVVMTTVLPDLNTVALFGVNKDLKTVIDDNFGEARFTATVAPVWRHLHQRSYNGVRGKLYTYAHDGQLELLSYAQNRFKFYNTFPTNSARDALYYILHVWKQLGLEAQQDELHLVGEIPMREWLIEELQKYIKRVYTINPAGDFNRSAVTHIEGMPYDLMTLFVKGR